MRKVFYPEYLQYLETEGYADYTLDELEEMPTIYEGHTADLKIETEDERVWLERVGVADGEWCNDKVTVEFFLNGKWETVLEYAAEC
jgi:hypothetical protein